MIYNMGIHLTPGRYLRLENKTFLIKSMNLAKKKTFRCDTDFSPAKKTWEIIFLNNFPPTLKYQTAKQGLINAEGRKKFIFKSNCEMTEVFKKDGFVTYFF